MRVLHVNKFLHRRGGAEGYMLDLAELQRVDGHEVAFFGMQHPDNDVASVGRPPRHVEFDPAPSGTVARLGLLGRMVWSVPAARGMAAAIEEFRPDVVHAHNVYHQLSPSVLHAASSRGVPVVLTLHDYKLVCPTYRFLDHDAPCTACVTRGPWEAARRSCQGGSRAASAAAALEVDLHRRFGAYDAVDRFLAPSRFLGDQVAAAGVQAGRVRVQPNFAVLGAPPEGPPADPRLVVAARLSSEKGVDTLVRAVGALDLTAAGVAGPAGPAGGTAGPVLDVAGDGPARAELERLAAAVAPGRVRFHGRLAREELHALMAGATASVVPSRWHENQPLSVLESQALGVPVVTTTLGGLPELVDETTGWLVPPDDPARLTEVLGAVLADPARARRRGLAGRARVARDHDPRTHLRSVVRHYQEAGAS
ncbi:glycosyltransferase [Nocardioides kribbensis]|uniref:Glycosyltransferase n=2 Tax=Nocardioides kribbensis TaxID=305517 RepID=A0ABV1NT25_9ACTN